MENIFYVNDFDGNTDDEKIDACFAAAKKVDKRTIVFDKKDYHISKAIEIPSNTEVIIDNCMIKHLNEVFDHIFRGDNLTINPDDPYGYPTEIRELKNIKITGKGTAVLEGPDKHKIGRHPFWAGKESKWSFRQEYQEMIGDYWKNPTTLVPAMDGTFSFHVQPLLADELGIKKNFKFCLEIEKEGYEKACKYFEIALFSSISSREIDIAANFYQIEDAILFKEED